MKEEIKPKFNIKRGDKIIARTPSVIDEVTFEQIGGHHQYQFPLIVTKVFSHGVRVKDVGYIHNNNILSKINP